MDKKDGQRIMFSKLVVAEFAVSQSFAVLLAGGLRIFVYLR
jgi:hypothetical protein